MKPRISNLKKSRTPAKPTALRWGFGRLCAFSLLIAFSIALLPQSSFANPSQEDVFRSINQNVGSTVDMRKYVPFFIAGLAGLILYVLYTQRRQRQIKPKLVNHSGKLMRRLAKSLHLRSIEMKQLKLLAQEQQLEHPLTLLLCPSILAKAMRTTNPKLDRKVMLQIVQRLRSGN
jgi:hypothetical protein